MAMSITPALAVVVDYNTTGTFMSSGNNVLSGANGLTVTYNNSANSVNVSGPVAATFGSFRQAGPKIGDADVVADHFTLTITQTVPSGPLTENVTDMFSGTITTVNGTTSTGSLTLLFTGGNGAGGAPVLGIDPIDLKPAYSFNLGGETYYVDQTLDLSLKGLHGITTTVDGAISAVPEPTFYALTGLGFAGLMAMAIRRRRQKQTPVI
jgi:hypothetical protein